MAALRPNLPTLPWQKVIFVADLLLPAAGMMPADERRDLERTDPETVAEVIDAIRSIGVDCEHVQTPGDLARFGSCPDGLLVLSTYAGGASRSRLTLVPAVAESLGLDFVGLDALGMALAHDKAVTKRLAADCGLLTPTWRVIRSPRDLLHCAQFPVPYVVKPIAEGSSIGIGQKNLIRVPEAGIDLAAALLERFEQPVLLEKFVGGREVSFLAIEADDPAFSCFVEVVVDGREDYFDAHLLSAEDKLGDGLPKSIRRIDQMLHETDRAGIERLLQTIGHYGCIRVDGKMHEGRFQFLELTPDPWLGPEGHLAQGFGASGMTYDDVIHAILASALRSPRSRAANG